MKEKTILTWSGMAPKVNIQIYWATIWTIYQMRAIEIYLEQIWNFEIRRDNRGKL
jgi:hypothetical protein